MEWIVMSKDNFPYINIYMTSSYIIIQSGMKWVYMYWNLMIKTKKKKKKKKTWYYKKMLQKLKANIGIFAGRKRSI